MVLGAAVVGVMFVVSPSPPLSPAAGLTWVSAAAAAIWVMAVFPTVRFLAARERQEARQEPIPVRVRSSPADRVVLVLTLVVLGVLLFTDSAVACSLAFMAAILAFFAGFGVMFIQVLLTSPARVEWPWAGSSWACPIVVVMSRGWVGYPIPRDPTIWTAPGWLLIGSSVGCAAWLTLWPLLVRRLNARVRGAAGPEGSEMQPV